MKPWLLSLVITLILLSGTLFLWKNGVSSGPRAGLLALLTVLSLAGLIITFGLWRQQRILTQFREQGIETTARIKEKRTKAVKRYSSSRINRRRDHLIEVSYFTRDPQVPESESPKLIERKEDGTYQSNFSSLLTGQGELIITEIPVTADQFQRLSKDEQLPVLYLPDNPQEARLKEDVVSGESHTDSESY